MVYLVQHAEAKNSDEDPERNLSEVGVTHARSAAQFLSEGGIRPRLVWHSGKLRAERTARILAEAIGGVEPTLHPGLGPSDDPSGIVEELVEVDDAGVMIVGHLPYLARLAAILLDAGAGQSPVRFRNAGIVALSHAEGAWCVEWAMPPQLMQRESRDR